MQPSTDPKPEASATTGGWVKTIAGLMLANGGSGGAGCLIPLMIIGAIFLGQWLDKMLGTAPYLLLALILTSAIAGPAYVFFVALQTSQEAYQEYMKKSQSGDSTKIP